MKNASLLRKLERQLERAVFRYDDLDPHKSPIELFEDALEDALQGNEDSDRFDAGLIAVFEEFRGLLRQDLERVELVNGRTLTIDSAAVERMSKLASKSYAPQRVRVAGRLETIHYSDCRFVLLLESNQVLKGTAAGPDREVLQTLSGQDVVVTGIAEFRPSGKLLLIEAERIERASAQDTRIWATLPKPLLPPAPTRQIREEQRMRGGLAAVLGKWPGQESDEGVRAALERLS